MSAEGELRGRRILIVESELALQQQLMDHLEEQEGAEIVRVSDPCSDKGAQLLTRYACDAAVVNVMYRAAIASVTMPILFYGRDMAVPPQHNAIVHALKEMLQQQGQSRSS